MKSNDDDRARVVRILALLKDDDRRWLQDRLAEPFERRARRLAERDLRIREYALAYHPLLSGRAMASAIAVAIDRYRASGWRFERDLPAPADPRGGRFGGYCSSMTGAACRSGGSAGRSPASSSPPA